jgi:hypothetical protein
LCPKRPVCKADTILSNAGLWDTQLIAKYLRELHNYTQPLPSRQIESALTGSIYDSYVRWIVWEGIRKWWNKDLESWLDCPTDAFHVDPAPTSAQTILGGPSDSRVKAMMAGVVCPSSWAKEPHTFNCGYVYPPNFDTAQGPVQLTPRYVGKIKDDKIIESLLAKGGIRLAATLNTILGDEADLRTYGLISTGAHFEEVENSRKVEDSRTDLDWYSRVERFLTNIVA